MLNPFKTGVGFHPKASRALESSKISEDLIFNNLLELIGDF